MSDTSEHLAARAAVAPWNKGRLVGQKPPLRLQEIWAIRIRLELGKPVGRYALS